MRMARKEKFFLAAVGLAVLISWAIIGSSLRVRGQTVDASTRQVIQQAAADIAELEAAYADIHGFVMSSRGTITDVMEAKQALDDKREALQAKTPPLYMAAIHEQIAFAAARCSNFGAMVASVNGNIRQDPFGTVVFVDVREYCIIQIHQARLMLIEYGQSKGVNPFAQ